MKRLSIWVGLITAAVCFAGDVAAQIEINIKQYQIPVLIDKDRNPILILEAQVPDKQYPMLKSIKLTLDGTTHPEDIEEIELYWNGDRYRLMTAAPVGRVRAIKNHIEITSAARLEPGVNHLYVTCRLKPDADLTGRIDAQVKSVNFENSESVKIDDHTGDIVMRTGVAVREPGDSGVHTYRIPGLTRTTRGTLLAVYDARRQSSRDLQGDIDIGLSRSTDGGQSWETMRIIMDMGLTNGYSQKLNGCSDPCILVDENTGDIFVFAVWMNGVFESIRGKDSWIHQWHSSCPGPGFAPNETSQFLMVKSTDDGKTWSKPINLTRALKKKEWKLFAPGPGNGITMKNGTIVIPAQGRDENNKSFSCIMYSKDHGKTWRVSNQALNTPKGTTESAVVELADGSLMLNMRDNRNGNNGPGRTVAVTDDMGRTWIEHPTSSNNTLPSPRCMAGLRTFDLKDKRLLFFSNPDSRKGRHHMTLKASFDRGRSWPEESQILLDELGSFGYSCITPVDDKHVGILYEGSQAHMVFQLIPVSDFMR